MEFLYLSCAGVPRETQEEKDFADFDIFDDPDTPFSTFNFQYPNEAFKRLHDLMEFNTLNNMDVSMGVKGTGLLKREVGDVSKALNLPYRRCRALPQCLSDFLIRFLPWFCHFTIASHSG